MRGGVLLCRERDRVHTVPRRLLLQQDDGDGVFGGGRVLRGRLDGRRRVPSWVFLRNGGHGGGVQRRVLLGRKRDRVYAVPRRLLLQHDDGDGVCERVLRSGGGDCVHALPRGFLLQRHCGDALRAG